jgi:hypothetical protein
MHAKYPIITVVMISIRCPACDEGIPNPRNGSFLFDWEDYEKVGERIACSYCQEIVHLRTDAIKAMERAAVAGIYFG